MGADGGDTALGLALSALIVVSFWCDVYEVPVSCGFAFTMLAMAGIWGALQGTSRQVVWLLMASLAYGLAVGARPSLLFGGIILLLPVIRAWHSATEPSFTPASGVVIVGGGGTDPVGGLGVDALQFPAFRQTRWNLAGTIS